MMRLLKPCRGIPVFACALLGLLVTGCSTSGPSPMSLTKNHPVVGVWEYLSEGKIHRREFTPDGKCIVYAGRPAVDKEGKPVWYNDSGEAILVGDFVVAGPRKVMVTIVDRRKRRLPYEVLIDGRLNVEDRFIAQRVK